ncbi:LysR family transcriptional regulator [Nocardioides caeni]|uniref:LysR family transcriptional regulator n=1 Tax=Nocardioides caeni TaxID=574700 RepID=A0A4S8NLY2_9ACTN|nr:LysR family transcriptional regulator [Nocardioides caeni]THV17878.1 LysR family transcriptional regulator [Nocardioides caeni]
MIDLRRLEALVALHRTGSVSAAAAELHYGQPTVSHHLRRLEAETGSVLLQRVGRGVRLTPDGERLARRGEEILGLLARAEGELAASTSLQAGRVRLAAFPSGAATVVPEALVVLAERHPGIELDLVEAEPPEAFELLRSGAVDLGLTFAYPDQPEPEQITSVPLLDDPLHLVVAADDGPAPDDLAGLSGHAWITGCERCRRELLALCEDAGFAPAIAFASDDYVAVQALVAGGMGVTVLPGLALRAHRHPGIATQPLAALRRVQLSTYGAPPRPPAVDAVAAALATAAAAGLKD